MGYPVAPLLKNGFDLLSKLFFYKTFHHIHFNRQKEINEKDGALSLA
jgi:hypothetical protein